MPIIATGQISIVDLTDGKSLSCYITSNLPKTQILDPNPGGVVNPDWSGTPKLILTPVVFANQTALALNAAGLSITWKRKEGAGAEAVTTTGEAASGGVPVVGMTFGYTDIPVAELNPDVVLDHFDGLYDAAASLLPARLQAAGG